MCNGTPFTIEKILASGGLELTTARSVGQRLTHWATRAPNNEEIFMLQFIGTLRVKDLYFLLMADILDTC